jgi:serine/threonine-protein kinase
LLNVVGNGRACQVWEAMNDALNERFALKVLPPDYAHDRQQLAMLRHEHAVGHGLEHANVIRTYEFDTTRKLPFLALEYFGPLNLKQLVLQGPDRIAYLVPKVVEQAAAGLAYLHGKGWIHRDIKPNNFLVCPKGDVKMIDFALAERQRGFLGRMFHRQSKVQGTRSYMSPEQIRRESLDPRADVYSFGCMAHELISGKPPFTGNSEAELLNKHLKSQPPSLEGINRNVTTDFSKLILRMLSKDPNNRPESMEAFLNDLRGKGIFRVKPKEEGARDEGRGARK